MEHCVQSQEGRAATVTADAGRFLGAGILNTLLTLAVYQLLLFIAPSVIAYTATWMIGIATVALVYPSHVFRGGSTTKTARALTGGIYAISFLIGMAAIQVLSVALGSERLAIFGALGVTTVFNFISMTVVLRGLGGRQAKSDPATSTLCASGCSKTAGLDT